MRNALLNDEVYFYYTFLTMPVLTNYETIINRAVNYNEPLQHLRKTYWNTENYIRITIHDEKNR